jgi:hypothetical protein
MPYYKPQSGEVSVLFSPMPVTCVAFDTPFDAQQIVSCSGIYICETCGFEIALASGMETPKEKTCNNHPSDRVPPARQSRGPVRWYLVAAAMNGSRPRQLESFRP